MKIRLSFLHVVVFLAIVIIHGCKTNTIESNDMYAGYDYYPLAEKQFVEYQVYDTLYNGSTTTDTTYYLKEVIGEQMTVGDEVWYKVNRYTRTLSSTYYPIQPDSVWSVCRNSRALIRKENNFDFVRISFPAKKGRLWDGNARNVYDSIAYTISVEGKPATINNQAFSRTLTVVESNRNFLYEVNQQSAIYASGVGMVQRDYLKLERGSQPSNLNTLLYRQRKVTRIIAHGSE